MSLIIVAGLLLGSATATTDTHRVGLDHRGQQVDVTYRSALDVEHKQVGTPAPGGRTSTLRCTWTARVNVEREARSPAGHLLTRTIAAGEAPIQGSRAGWCAGQRDAIAQDVAARSGDVRAHLLAAAARDRDTLALELDAAHAPARS